MSTGEAPTPPSNEIQIFKAKVEWNVQRSAFDAPEGSKDPITSKEFRASPDSKVSWQLRIYPRGDNNVNSSDSMSLFLRARNIADPVRVKYRLGLIGSDGTEMNTRDWDKVFAKAEYGFGWGTSNFIRRDVLFDPTKNFFRDDQLTIFCDLEAHWNLNVQEREVQVPESTWIHDWSELLDSGDLSDVVLVVGGEEIKAHKLVLSARSHVFAAMFKYNMVENQTGRVEIPDLDVVAVKALLTFLYSDKVKDLESIAEKVLPAADKYGVERLKILCEKEICKKLFLTVENVVDMLRLAELHTAKTLKARALEFISLNAAEVVAQESFWDLNEANRDLFREAVCFSHLRSEQAFVGSQVNRRNLN